MIGNCMKKKFFVLGIIVFVAFIALIVIGDKLFNNVDEYATVGEYVLSMREYDNSIIYFNSEQGFLQQCNDENIRSIVEKEIRIQSIEIISDDMVVIINYTGLFTKKGYLIVRNDVEVPNEKLELVYEWANYRKIDENIYKFTWFPILL